MREREREIVAVFTHSMRCVRHSKTRVMSSCAEDGKVRMVIGDDERERERERKRESIITFF